MFGNPHVFALVFTVAVGLVIACLVGRRQLRLDALKDVEQLNSPEFSPRHRFSVPADIQRDALVRTDEAQRIALAQFVLTYWSFIRSRWSPIRFFEARKMQIEIEKVFMPMTGAGGQTHFSAQQVTRNLANHPQFLTCCIRYADVIVKGYRHFNYFRPFRIGASWLPEDTTIIALQGYANYCAEASRQEAAVRTQFDLSHGEAVRLLRYTLTVCFGSAQAMEPFGMPDVWCNNMQYLRVQLAHVITKHFDLKKADFTADNIDPYIDQLARQVELMSLLVDAADTIQHHYDRVCGTSDWHDLDPGSSLVSKLVARKSLSYMNA